MKEWNTERYAVKHNVIYDMLMRLQASIPEVDVFADWKNSRWARFWRLEGEKEDAWQEAW